jgi:hypothetical protein
MIKNRKNKKERKVVVFDFEDEAVEPETKIQMKPSVVNIKRSVETKSEYTADVISQLKRAQLRPTNESTKSNVKVDDDVVFELPESIDAIVRDKTDDFIALDKPKDLLKQEDDDIDEIDDFEFEFEDQKSNKFRFGPDAAKIAMENNKKQMIASFKYNTRILINSSVDSDSDDDWQLNQIKKGAPSQIKHQLFDQEDLMFNIPKHLSNVPEFTQVPSITSIQATLTTRLNTLAQELNKKQQENDQAKNSLEFAIDRIKTLEKEIDTASTKHTYFDNLATYISSLAQFIDAKTEEFSELESKWLEYNKSLKDTEDQQRMKQMHTDFSGICDYYYLPDANMQQDEPENTRRDLLRQANNMFDQVLDEFKSIPTIKERLLEWKETYPSEFKQTYASLSFPQVFALFVRYEMFGLDLNNVLSIITYHQEYNDIEEQEWYQQLSTIEPTQVPDDKDLIYIHKLILEKTILPVYKAHISTYFDSFSNTQTNHIVSFIKNLHGILGSNNSNKTTDTISRTIHQVLSTTINTLDTFDIRKRTVRLFSTDTKNVLRLNESCLDAWLRNMEQLLLNVHTLNSLFGNAFKSHVNEILGKCVYPLYVSFFKDKELYDSGFLVGKMGILRDLLTRISDDVVDSNSDWIGYIIGHLKRNGRLKNMSRELHLSLLDICNVLNAQEKRQLA